MNLWKSLHIRSIHKFKLYYKQHVPRSFSELLWSFSDLALLLVLAT